MPKKISNGVMKYSGILEWDKNYEYIIFKRNNGAF
jgi:hypothetical protein